MGLEDCVQRETQPLGAFRMSHPRLLGQNIEDSTNLKEEEKGMCNPKAAACGEAEAAHAQR